MAAFYFDNDVAVRTATVLRNLGHDAVTARELDARQYHDPEQLLFAAEMRRTLVTHNARDFRLLHAAWILWSERWETGQSHSGILIIPQARWNPDDTARELHRFTETGIDLANHMIGWSPRDGWRVMVVPRNLATRE